jgi:hypothetical protein
MNRTELMARSSNCCCICQTPFIHAHHIDGNRDDDVFDNLAPLCPNHHSFARARSNMFLNVTPERVKALRDIWYLYVEKRKESLGKDFGTVRLTVKNFVREMGEFGATYGWAKTFASLNAEYAKLTVNQIIDRVFSTSNPADLKILLETMKNMYVGSLRKSDAQKRFREVCNAFGFDYDGKNII